MKEWDMDALKTMALIHQSHSCDRDKGIGLCSEDVANALLFLVSDKSKGINGAIIPIDNAWSTI
jgi:enoyl-[acyl-carrier-protein] reductase (NADH)